jgi:hypothetical protein
VDDAPKSVKRDNEFSLNCYVMLPKEALRPAVGSRHLDDDRRVCWWVLPSVKEAISPMVGVLKSVFDYYLWGGEERELNGRCGGNEPQPYGLK